MIPQKGLIFISKTYKKPYYYNPWDNTQSWTSYDIETSHDDLQNIIGNWKIKLSRNTNQPYFFNPVTNISEWKIPPDYSIIFANPLYDYYVENGVPLASYIGVQSMIPDLDITRITSGCEMVVDISKVIELIIRKSPNIKSIDFSKCTLTISNIKSLVKLQNLEQIIINSDTIIPPLQKPLPFKIMINTEEGYVRVALFYDILPEIYPEYGNKLSYKLLENMLLAPHGIADLDGDAHFNKVNEFIIEHDIPSGDILYIGTNFFTHLSYGFVFVNRQENKSLIQYEDTEFLQGILSHEVDELGEGETVEQNIINSITAEIREMKKYLKWDISTSIYYTIAAKQIIIFERDGILKGIFVGS